MRMKLKFNEKSLGEKEKQTKRERSCEDEDRDEL